MKEKILTRIDVNELCLNGASVITADMLEGYTRIENYAFAWISSFTSVTIPDSVTNIGDGAFRGCHNLTSVIIPNSITNIGSDTFRGCSNLTSIEIPNSVTNIGSYAFHCCTSLTSVTIPNSVTSIGDGAFYSCYSLTSVTIGNNITSIGQYAFYKCIRLTSIEIPNSVTRIGYRAFRYCSSLTSVTIGNNITSIGQYAFYDCNFKQENRIDNLGRIIACKGFNVDMTCRLFQYKEGETYEIEGEPILCERGFHACLNPMDCFGYYYGQIGKDIVFHEVYLEEMSDEKSHDSKVVARKITIGREIGLPEMADIASGRK